MNRQGKKLNYMPKDYTERMANKVYQTPHDHGKSLEDQDK